MTDIQILVYATSLEKRTTAANNIITGYDLHFSVNDIIRAFDNLQHSGYQIPATLMRLVLTANLRMFIAIVYALIDNNMPRLWQDKLLNGVDWVTKDSSVSITLGCTHVNQENIEHATKIWTALYDYYEFDISELELADCLREAIQQHIDSKQPYTKRAIKK